LGDPGDWDLLVSYFRSPERALRLCALAGLCRLDAERAREFLLEALVDESPPVVRAAHRRLSRHRTRPLLEELEMILEIAQDAHSVEAALSISRRLNKWDELIILLVVLHEQGENRAQVREKAFAQFAQWLRRFNRSFSRLTDEQRNRILPLWNRIRPQLNPAFVQRIDWCLAE
jgi:hypothetical protein